MLPLRLPCILRTLKREINYFPSFFIITAAGVAPRRLVFNYVRVNISPVSALQLVSLFSQQQKCPGYKRSKFRRVQRQMVAQFTFEF